ncbi:hypothetical protein J6590_068030 [Homalodisca vitripennis]|nr:hypothetical protein J6590_068030 [Homalodisca vitripennis]
MELYKIFLSGSGFTVYSENKYFAADPLQVNVRLSGGARKLHAGLEEMLQQRNSACYLGSSSTRDLWRFMGNEKSDFPCWNGVLSRELFIPCGRRYLTSALNVQSPFNMCFEDVMNSKITSFSKIENEFTTSYMVRSGWSDNMG